MIRLLTVLLISAAVIGAAASAECTTADQMLDKSTQLNIHRVAVIDSPLEIDRLRMEVSKVIGYLPPEFERIDVYSYLQADAPDYQIVKFVDSCANTAFPFSKQFIDKFLANK
jgi:hypothetical protein